MEEITRRNSQRHDISGMIVLCLIPAFALCVLGFSTPSWATERVSVQEGLWQKCSCSFNGNPAGWFKAVQGLMSLGVFGLLIALIMAVIYQFCHCLPMNANIMNIGAVATLTVLGNVAGLILFALMVNDDKAKQFSYSFYLEAIGTGMALACAIFTIVHYYKVN